MSIATKQPLELADFVRDVPDFPKPGIMFRDLTPLLGNLPAFKQCIDDLFTEVYRYDPDSTVEVVGAFDARGFWFGPSVAMKLGVGWFPIRKPGKLPHTTVGESFSLEYRDDERLEMHLDAIKPDAKVVLIDDVLATGGTMLAGCKLVEKLGGKVVGCFTVIELEALAGRKLLKGYEVRSLLKY